jgi:hypothetical protein
VDSALDFLRLWAQMNQDAGLDLAAHGIRENEVLKKFDGLLTRPEDPWGCRIVELVCPNDPTMWTIKFRQYDTLEVYELHHLPGTFDPKNELPRTIC